MNKLNIIYDSASDDAMVYYNRQYKPNEIGLYSWDGIKFEPHAIRVGTASPHWQMNLCHEIGHILSLKTKKHKETRRELMRREVIAWRLAKSFCKSIYWNENHAVECLRSYALTMPGLYLALETFRIIPLNTNKWYIK